MLRSRLPLSHIALASFIEPFDLHALDTPPAFILSQDQTLSKKYPTSLLAELRWGLCLTYLPAKGRIGIFCEDVVITQLFIAEQ